MSFRSLLRAARIGQRAERRRILDLLADYQWGASISPQPAGRVLEERLEHLRRAIVEGVK